jgi:hypothetical protein
MPNPSTFSPLYVLLGQSSPAASADWQLLSFELYVNFDVMILAFFTPWILATFHENTPCIQTRAVLLLSLPSERHWPIAERDELK